MQKGFDRKKDFFTVGKAANYYDFEVVDIRLIGKVVTNIDPDSFAGRHILSHSLSTVRSPALPNNSLDLHGFDEPFSFKLDGNSLGIPELSTHEVTQVSLHKILIELDRAMKDPRFGHEYRFSDSNLRV